MQQTQLPISPSFSLLATISLLAFVNDFTVNLELLVVFVHGAEAFLTVLLEKTALGVRGLVLQVLIDGSLAVVQLDFLVNQFFVLGRFQAV